MNQEDIKEFNASDQVEIYISNDVRIIANVI